MKSSDTQMELVRRYLGGEATQEEAQRLESMLAVDAQLRRDYLAYARVEAGLSSKLRPQMLKPGAAPQRQDWKRAAMWAAAACLALMVSAWWWSQLGVAMRVVAVSEGATNEWKAGDVVRAGHLKWMRGALELELPSGVRLAMNGPTDMELVSAMKVRLFTGKVTADVGASGKGFVIETPETRVVDLGTVFGVDATSVAKTDVVVFKGQVEVFEKGAKERLALLNQGEGLRVERNRRASRIVSVMGADDPGAWSAQERAAEGAVITAVGDSMSASDEEAKKWPTLRGYYRIVTGGLRSGALAFSDAMDTWRDVPPELTGADQVRTFTADSHNWWMKLTVELSGPSELFIFVDQRNPVPQWVRDEFNDTGKVLTLEFRHAQTGRLLKELPFAIWRRVVDKAGPVTLGAPYEHPPADGRSFNPNRMFAIAAKALR